MAFHSEVVNNIASTILILTTRTKKRNQNELMNSVNKIDSSDIPHNMNVLSHIQNVLSHIQI